MIVESDPILRHGEDVADHSVHSVRHSPDGTVAHYLVAKWDGAEPIEGNTGTCSSKSGMAEQSEKSADKNVDGISADSSKSENWRRRRAASIRRMGSSMSSQPHMTASLQHRPENGETRLYRPPDSPPPHNVSHSDHPAPPRENGGANDRRKLCSLEEEELTKQKSFSDVKVVSSDELDAKEPMRLPDLDGTDASSSPKSSDCTGGPGSAADTHSFRAVVCRSPPPAERKGLELPPSANTTPAPPVAADLPDIIELNIDLLVGRDTASRVDGDSGGMLHPLESHAEQAPHPISGVAHLVLFGDDLAAEGSRTLDLPVRRRSPALGATPVVSNRKVSESEKAHTLVELGDDARLRVMVEIVSPVVKESYDDAPETSIQWTLSGASAAVAAGEEEADDEDVSMAKITDEDQAYTSSELLATDGAMGRRGRADEGIPRTGMFCAALPDVVGILGAFSKKCIINCVDHCDDDALVYVNDGDEGDSMASTIDTVYSKIMY